MSIQERAMLSQLSIHQWSARRVDKRATSEVEANHAVHNVGRFNKLLVPKETLEPIGKIANKLREKHYKMTLPWHDEGARLLPSKLYFDYMAAIHALQNEFNNATETFCSMYPQLLVAAPTRLNTLYNANDFPTVDSIRYRFSVGIQITPVPSAQDFRVDVMDAERKKIQRDIEAHVSSLQAKALTDCLYRMKDAVGRMKERLSDKEAIFRDSLVLNIRELVQLLPGLNVTDDPEIDRLTRQMTENLCESPVTLRNNEKHRLDTAAEAGRILSSIESVLNARRDSKPAELLNLRQEELETV